MVHNAPPKLNVLSSCAGRLGPGVCYRLWSEAAHSQRQEATPPEILSADLAPLALQLACSKCAPMRLPGRSLC